MVESEVARRRELEVKLAESRQKLYSPFMHQIWSKAMDGSLTETDVVATMKPWNRDMFLVASDEVITKYLALLTNSNLLTGAELLKAMRRDMGNPNTALTTKQVLQTFIKPEDWPDIDALVQSKTLPGGSSTAIKAAGETAAVDAAKVQSN